MRVYQRMKQFGEHDRDDLRCDLDRKVIEQAVAEPVETKQVLQQTQQQQQAEKKYECVRWAWTGDVYDRKVFCLEWREKK